MGLLRSLAEQTDCLVGYVTTLLTRARGSCSSSRCGIDKLLEKFLGSAEESDILEIGAERPPIRIL